MYFNEEKNNTSIDRELNEKTITSSIKKNLKLIIIIIIVLLLLFLIILLANKKGGVTFQLLGDTEMQIPQGTKFTDPGFIATNKKGIDISNEVNILGNVETNNMGTYRLIYTLRGKTLKRMVTVVDAEKKKAKITLKGDKLIYIDINSTYSEPGYTCTDSVDGDITDKVVVDNRINNKKAGAYKIIYSVTNSQGVTTIASRVVIIVG